MTLPTLSLALLLAPATALAVDLNDLVVGWTNVSTGQDGSDGEDEARDVVITPANEIIAVGYLDGAVNHGKDGFAINYETDGTSNWDFTIDSGDVTSATLLGSNDRLNGVAVRSGVNTMAWCGTRGQDTTTSADADVVDWSYLAVHDPLVPNSKAPPAVDFDVYGRDGSGLVSPVTTCTGVDYTDDQVAISGWSSHSDFGGRWFNNYYTDVTGFLVGRHVYSDDSVEEPTVPDKAYAIAQRDDGLIAIVGTRGFSGVSGGIQNDTNWFVRVIDPPAVLWEHTFAGDEDLEDIAFDVAFDPSGTINELVVVGTTNAGTNNTTSSDRNWLIISYNALGDGVGGADIIFTTRFGGGSGADEVATSVAYDDDGNILVAGSGSDAVSGNEVWRVAKYNRQGDLIGTQFWEGQDWGGDSRVNGVAVRDDRVLMAGYIDDGKGRDFAVTMLEADFDNDGVSDSVDGCRFDPAKSDPGVCGCNSPDNDFDMDGSENCIDECPTDPNKTERGVCPCEAEDVDTDGDGREDCLDECPADPDKIELGMCGCGAPDEDEDGDNIINCFDACLGTPKGAEIDEFGCSEFVREEPTDGGNTDGGSDGSGCTTSTGGAPLGSLVLLGLLLRSRRRQA